jgi:hypothetical protein
MGRPFRRHGSGLGVWGTGRADGPIVVRVDADTARGLGVPLGRLEEAAAAVVPWGRHQDGQLVYRVRELQAQLHPELAEATG